MTTNMTLREAIQEAIRDFTEYGFDHPTRLSEWMVRLHAVARKDSPSPDLLQARTKAAMETYFKRATSFTVARRNHPGVNRYAIDRIKPELRAEMTRRVMASTDLIKLNRDQAVQKTLQRFSGWATSVPAGGSRVVDKSEVASDVGKTLRQVKYKERRVTIDQGHKLMASVDAVIAQQTGAIAGMWRSHWRQSGYDYRPDHKERDKQFYAIRGSWAMEEGLINKGVGYLDEMTQAAEEPFCRCYVVYVQNLRDLPDEMLTAKGRKLLEETRVKAA